MQQARDPEMWLKNPSAYCHIYRKFNWKPLKIRRPPYSEHTCVVPMVSALERFHCICQSMDYAHHHHHVGHYSVTQLVTASSGNRSDSDLGVGWAGSTTNSELSDITPGLEKPHVASTGQVGSYDSVNKQ